MNPVELYINEKEGNQKQILEFLHFWILSSDAEIYPKLNYGIPFYYKKSWICYLNSTNHGSVEIAFTRANELMKKASLMEFGTRKQVAGIMITDLASLPLEDLNTIMSEALAIDESVKYSVKKK
jgi:hypothetical protein